MKTYKLFMSEAVSSINPDVSWVEQMLQSVDASQMFDVYDLVDRLTELFSPHKVLFTVERRGTGSGVFKDREAAATGVVGANFSGFGGDYEYEIYLNSSALKNFIKSPTKFGNKLKQLLKHELIHAEQTRRAGKSLGSSAGGDMYWADPHELGAIASEVETQLLAIESDKSKLMKMMRSMDKKLEKSDRWRLYVHLVKEQPKFRKAFEKLIKMVYQRLA